MKTYYTCGSRRNVRGNCGRKHRTIDAAEKCCHRDQSACKSQGGYSDRDIRKIQDGQEVPLEQDEHEWLYRVML